MALTDSQKSSIESKKRDIESKKRDIENIKRKKCSFQSNTKIMIAKYKESLKSAKNASEKDTYKKAVVSTTNSMKDAIENFNKNIVDIKRNIESIKAEINRIKSR